MTFLVGTRGSKLSLAQTNWVISELKKENEGSEFEIKTITTKGDTDSRALFTIDQKGIFEKEIDKAVAEKEIDFAVHSLKDVPSVKSTKESSRRILLPVLSPISLSPTFAVASSKSKRISLTVPRTKELFVLSESFSSTVIANLSTFKILLNGFVGRIKLTGVGP